MSLSTEKLLKQSSIVAQLDLKLENPEPPVADTEEIVSEVKQPVEEAPAVNIEDDKKEKQAREAFVISFYDLLL